MVSKYFYMSIFLTKFRIMSRQSVVCITEIDNHINRRSYVGS